MNRHIDPIAALGHDLLSVQNPVRYLGGEFGQIVKSDPSFTFALAFPDLYEIAMSNTAIKLLYDGLNRLPNVRCERVFSPAPDFESVLKRRGIPLYTLESGIPVSDVDILGVSIGYEPGITGLLSILETGQVPLECADRTDRDPIVLAGGCGITNPLPYARFIDAFFIGEAEAGMYALIGELAEMTRRGATRSDLLDRLTEHPSVWTKAKDDKRLPGSICARRAVYQGFGSSSDRAVCFPIPNVRVVQDHGVVEIMRGCPNGCRFCHAGVYYRPQRMMSVERIVSDVDFLVNRGGYREISLMSLSSGDYEGIGELLDELTSRYGKRNVSFQLPSIKVNSFTLPLLEKMSEVRKSGLTLAIETPVDAWQLALNKEVFYDRTVEILLEAKRRGWSQAKFYFMIGLPVEKGGQKEEIEIVNFLMDVQARTRMQCNANIGTFIPKPHTAYQWSRQLSIPEVEAKLSYIHSALPRGRFKVNSPRPFNSFVEGVLSRGDERVGGIILEAYRRGCRLDAWDDWARPDIWKAVIEEQSWDVAAETLRERALEERLPWDGVNLGVSKAFLVRERQRSDSQELTPRCEEHCETKCGVCGTTQSLQLVTPLPRAETSPVALEETPVVAAKAEAVQRFLVSFSKLREAAFIPHLSLTEVWNKAFQRSGLPVVFTEGFNPLPRLELAQTLSLGISSDDEVASFLLNQPADPAEVIQRLNESLPPNLRILRISEYPIARHIKREPLSRFFWGSGYLYQFDSQEILERLLSSPEFQTLTSPTTHPFFTIQRQSDTVLQIRLPFTQDRPFRDLIAQIGNAPIHEIVSIHKTHCFAQTPETRSEPTDFFQVFEGMRKVNLKALGMSV
jgi:radical SAM family uncharacterized protein